LNKKFWRLSKEISIEKFGEFRETLTGNPEPSYSNPIKVE